MRRNCTELSPTSIAHQHLSRVLGSWWAANPNQPVAQLRFQRCAWRTWRLFRLCGFPEHKNAGKYEYIGMLSGIVSCDAAAIRIRIRIVRCQRPAKRQKHKHCETQARFIFPPLLLVGSKELVLKVPKRGQFHVAIRVTRKRCDSCAQVALGTRTVSRRNF